MKGLRKKNKMFKEIMLVEIYRGSKQGLSEVDVAQLIGVDLSTLRKWKKERYSVKHAWDEGRKADPQRQPIKKYLYDNLSDHLKPVWDQIMRCETEPSAIGQMEAMLENCGSNGLKHLFLYALVHFNFNVTKARKSIGVSKFRLEGWLSDDQEFAEMLNEIHAMKKDLYEEELVKLVKSGDPGAVMFVNKTFNADRGYALQKNVKHQHEHGGTVKHQAVPISELDIPLEQKIQMRDAIRAKQLPEGKN